MILDLQLVDRKRASQHAISQMTAYKQGREAAVQLWLFPEVEYDLPESRTDTETDEHWLLRTCSSSSMSAAQWVHAITWTHAVTKSPSPCLDATARVVRTGNACSREVPLQGDALHVRAQSSGGTGHPSNEA